MSLSKRDKPLTERQLAESCIWSIKGREPKPEEVEALLESWANFGPGTGPGIDPLELATALPEHETWEEFLARDLTPPETEQVRALLLPYLADTRLVPDQYPKSNVERLALELWWSRRY